ncbi:unnamed protein product [Paramecium pentaurelia]|uniref:Uncharacterized protein n=1 Tax=Paramecium pentaurelia TaxID=43138 RepID=A0A8S1YGL8_9CILI|nr:unnamed protein product [Paramecium pentaurelia]
MADKKQQGQAKPGVKFWDQPASIQQVENKPQVIYKNVTEQSIKVIQQRIKIIQNILCIRSLMCKERYSLIFKILTCIIKRLYVSAEYSDF